MTEQHDHEETATDPLIVGAKRAAVHLTKAGFEVFAALGALSKGVVAKVRPDTKDEDEDGSGPQRVPVD